MVGIEITVPSYSLVYDRKRVRTTLRQVGAEIAKIDRVLLKKSVGSGRKYGKHTASAPGQAPASLSGALAKSVTSRVSRDGTSVSIKEGMFYAKFLEAGASGGGRQRSGGGSARTKGGRVNTKRILQPRPSLALAFAQVQPTLKSRIIAALDGSIEFVRSTRRPNKPV